MLIHIYIYLLIHRDGRFRVNDEIINVNGSSLRGLSMEQVFAFVLFLPNHRYLHVMVLAGEECFEEHLTKRGYHNCSKSGG